MRGCAVMDWCVRACVRARARARACVCVCVCGNNDASSVIVSDSSEEEVFIKKNFAIVNFFVEVCFCDA